MGSCATTGGLLHSLLLFSTLVCCARAAGILGFTEDGSTSIYEILKKDDCCTRRFRFKTIEQAHYQNGIKYNCKATVKQWYCGGNCKTDSEYKSGITRLDRNFRPIGWADEPSATVENKQCRINQRVTQTYNMRCRAERGCCQEVEQEEITVQVQVMEPASGDNGCSCDTVSTATLNIPCQLYRRWQYLYYVAWPWRCRSLYPLYLSYCSGCCPSNEDYYAVLNVVYRIGHRKHCTCCQGTGYRLTKALVYCWNLFEHASFARDNSEINVVDADGNRVAADVYDGRGWKFESVDVWYISECKCVRQNCR